MIEIYNNKYDVYKWVEKVIDSCKTHYHFKGADALITNFHNKYDDWQLTGKLRVYSSDRYYKINK